MSEISQGSISQRTDAQRIGNLTARANISNEIKRALVPGEVAQKHWPEMFKKNQPLMISEELKATQTQIDEYLTYQPCGNKNCQRKRYDPDCRCLSNP